MSGMISTLFQPQFRRLLTFNTPALGADTLLLESYSGSESVSQLFDFELVLLSQNANLPLKSLIGQPGLIQIELADGSHRPIHGYISAFGLIDSDNGVARYQATLSPWLWMLGRRSDARIYQEKTVEDVLRAVFARYENIGRYEFQLGRALRNHSYLTQYNETDLSFVLRLLEGDGLFFYFRHAEDGHTLVIADNSKQLAPLAQQPSIRFHRSSMTEEEDTISQWSADRVLQPGVFSTRTFDYKNPANPLDVSLQSLNDQGDIDHYEQYRFDTQYTHVGYEQGQALMRNRIEAMEAQAKVFTGHSNCRALQPGYRFTLTQHYRHERDNEQDRNFLLLAVHHQGQSNYLNDTPAQYENTFECIRAKIPYRPPLLTPRPTIGGPLTATVIGPEGEEVFTDELGRIQVRFHWQRVGSGATPDDQQALNTTWVRVAMPSAGEGFGHQFLPRIGQEVLVSFIAGDIDRPVASAALYNGLQPTPRFSGEAGLPGNRTLSGIKTREHKGQGHNELLFDDTPGALRARVASTHQASELNLGKLAAPRADGKAEPRGEGAELRSDAAIAVRAAHGLLLTTYARERARGGQLDHEELQKLLTECADLFKSLGQTATARGAPALDSQGIDALQRSLEQWPAADSATLGDAVLASTAEAGIVSATPRSQAHYAGENYDTTAQDHLQMTAGAGMRLQAGQGISAFAQDAGITAIANRGKVLVQAQEDDVVVNAQKNIQLSAAEGEVLVTAPTIRLVADDGSYIRIGGGIEIGTQGKAVIHASTHDWVGPKAAQALVPAFDRDGAQKSVLFHYPGHTEESPRLATGHSYKMTLEDGSVLQGVTDAQGLTEKIEREAMQRVSIDALKDLLS